MTLTNALQILCKSWHVVCMWYPCGVHVTLIWCAYDTHLVCMWHPHGVHVIPMWYACDSLESINTRVGCIKDCWTNTRLVCTNLNVVLMLNPNMAVKIWVLKFSRYMYLDGFGKFLVNYFSQFLGWHQLLEWWRSFHIYLLQHVKVETFLTKLWNKWSQTSFFFYFYKVGSHQTKSLRHGQLLAIQQMIQGALNLFLVGVCHTGFQK